MHIRNLSYVVAILLLAAHVSAEKGATVQEPFFLRVVDQNTGIGVPGASVAIGPGDACLGLTDPQIFNWTAHYVTDAAGRISMPTLPLKFSCRVERNGKVLEVVSTGPLAARPWTGPKWLQLRHATEVSLTVAVTPLATEDDLHYWEHTSDPAQFRSYIEDLDNGDPLSNVTVKSVRSGVSTTTDSNGLFTLDIPAQYWKGVSPPGAMDTLLFSKSGYRSYEIRDVILHPGVAWLDIYLEKGSGKVVRKNNGRNGMAEFFELKPGEREKTDPRKAEILSLNIEPATYEGGWIMCTDEGTKAVLKARNLKSVDIFWYSTGTGIGEMPPAKAGPMRKVKSSADGDTWEIEMPDLMATDFWAEGKDREGNVIKSMDLGNVSWDFH